MSFFLSAHASNESSVYISENDNNKCYLYPDISQTNNGTYLVWVKFIPKFEFVKYEWEANYDCFPAYQDYVIVNYSNELWEFNSDFTQFREIQDDYYTDGCDRFYTIFNDNPKWEFIRPNSFQLDVAKAVRKKIKN